MFTTLHHKLPYNYVTNYNHTQKNIINHKPINEENVKIKKTTTQPL